MLEKRLWFPLYNGKLLLFGPRLACLAGEDSPLLSGKTQSKDALNGETQGKNTVRTKRDDLRVFAGIAPPVPAAGMLHAVGEYDGMPCVAYAAAHDPDAPDEPQPCDPSSDPEAADLDCVAVSLRAVHAVIGMELYGIAGRGEQMLFWDKRSRHCSVCGGQTELAAPICKRCPACGNEMYPVVTPAVLVLVRRDDRILLVRGREFTRPFFSLVAGFVEPGETLEECVIREVLEETGLTVGNVRYFQSQPWPFPSNLMIGFTVDWVSGELSLQEDELLAGAFYARAELPALPNPFSLARRMIDDWAHGACG